MALAGIFSNLYVTLGGTQGEECAFTDCTSQFAMITLPASWVCKFGCNSIWGVYVLVVIIYCQLVFQHRELQLYGQTSVQMPPWKVNWLL